MYTTMNFEWTNIHINVTFNIVTVFHFFLFWSDERSFAAPPGGGFCLR